MCEGWIGIPNGMKLLEWASRAMGWKRSWGGETRTKRSEAAKRTVPAEIELENWLFGGAQLNEIGVAADLEGVFSVDQADIICELKPSLDAIDRRVGFAAKVRVSRNVHTDLIATGKLRKAKV